MDTFNSYNKMAVANGSAPYIPLHLREMTWTDNMSPKFKGFPKYKGYEFACGSNEDSAVGGFLEPPHVHAQLGDDFVAKLWLDDERTGMVSVNPHKSKGVPQHVMDDLIKHVQTYQDKAFDARDARIKEKNLLATMNPKELVKFNEREQKRDNAPFIPPQQKQGK